MRIAIDAMGGDHAPDEIVAGAVEARKVLGTDDELILIGIEDKIKSLLDKHSFSGQGIQVVHAPDVVGMNDSPVESIRKKRKSSIALMAKMASTNEADAVLSAGNTGACVAACQLRMRNLPGVLRPGIAVTMPTFGGPFTMCDVGANVACKPINLYQYAVMACIYVRQMYGIENPRVGLMGIGEEAAKGNELVKKTRELILADPQINFIGNIEGRDVLDGVCDVAICEGFVGNVILKLTEGLVDGLFGAIKHELLNRNKLLALIFKSVMRSIYKKYDYHEYGGALLLGVNGTAVISHGSSKSRTIKNAILASREFYMKKINDKIVERISTSSVRTNGEQ